MSKVDIRIEGKPAEELGNSFALMGTDHIENDAITEAITDWDIDSTESEGVLSDGPTIEALNLMVEVTRGVGAQVIAMWIWNQVSDDSKVSIEIDGETVDISEEELRNKIDQAASEEGDEET